MSASYPIAARGALLALLAALGLGVASPAKAQVVISQVYGGGGNNGSLYRNDFVELFNRGAAPVNVTGWSLQFTNATATVA
ncbi:MAG TPA: lamin tail domain-containing protein, partial [Pseudomonadota bacterium]|nr:lamin tail domain-containing protein [Pseudomonadota bacterium]